ncbi:hypothetical protein ACFS7Z_19850 [Pontibacter toksunensis]|uniref:Uncharacterized protein n=2 Tax=Pontibacter toksunensis TaxID=1332631 RepID=A0ABW6BZ15_9BACT
MEKEFAIYAFIKAVKKQYFDSFINDGQICMNTAKWFREYEETDDNVGDAGEGAIASWGSGFTVSVGDPIEEYTLEERIKETRDESNRVDFGPSSNFMLFNGEDANILSLYAITTLNSNVKEHKHFVPEKFIDEFSDHRFVLIFNPCEFVDRIRKRLNILNKSLEEKMVKYYPVDDKMRGNLDFFCKQKRYSYQNEYRLKFNDENPKMQIIDVGALNDVCFEIDLNNHIYNMVFTTTKLTLMRSGNVTLKKK